MGILKNYQENKPPLTNLSYDGFGPKPLVVKEAPEGNISPIRDFQISSRTDDLERISKFLTTTPQGIKYLAKEAALNQIYNTEGKGAILRNAAFSAANIIKSTLAQTALSGTGFHTLKGTIVPSYLNSIYKRTNNPNFVSELAPVNEDFGKRHFTKLAVEGEEVFFTSEGNGGVVGDKVKGGFTDQISSVDRTTWAKFQSPTGDIPVWEKAGENDNNKKLVLSTAARRLSKEVRVGLGNQIRQGRVNYTEEGVGTQDAINMLHPISGYDDTDTVSRDIVSKIGRDLVKFRFEIITPDDSSNVLLFFRAFLDGFRDSYSTQLNSFKYVGRAEDFHTYGGFSRSFNFDFKIAAQTREELKPIYQKMVWLASSTAPTYGSNAFMRGTLAKITIGSYLYRTAGYINNLTYSWKTEYPWEIAMNTPEEKETGVQELPQVLDCSVTFTPIHSFLPETKYLPYITNPVPLDGDNKFDDGTQLVPITKYANYARY